MSPIKQQKACFISIKFYCNCYYYILTYGVDHHHHHQSAEEVLQSTASCLPFRIDAVPYDYYYYYDDIIMVSGTSSVKMRPAVEEEYEVR